MVCLYLMVELSPVEERERDGPDSSTPIRKPKVIEPERETVTLRRTRSMGKMGVHKSASASALTLHIPTHGKTASISSAANLYIIPVTIHVFSCRCS